MAKTGRPRKPEGTQQGHYENAIVPLADQPLAAAASPDWLPATKDKWDSYWMADVARAATEVDLSALGRLFTYYDEWERCYAAAKDGGRMVEGSQGQPVLNPLYKHMDSLEGLISKLEAELGMTPLARQRLGLAITETKKSVAELNKMAEEPNDDTEALEAEWEAG